ncbi:MAG: UMP kinase [Gammaproteobacteria bacterium RIFCSPHIGHO2_12_FULL_40_19]|nr:MAG: UMP kinase [Gammaproteobacteria bacterium RIFCSPHIGHO2_12_FULL_40_19]
MKSKYRRILLKMSGEALMGDGVTAISPAVLNRLANEINEVRQLGVQIAIVIGGGNFCRGVELSEVGINRITGDHMGMVATIMNALALRDAFERSEMPVRILSAVAVGGMVDLFNRRKAIHHLEQGRILIFAAGTGNPLFTTDSAASLRGIEIGADVVMKATNVDGVYSDDPRKNPTATLYKHLTYAQALEKEFAVMDLAAFCQCRDYQMPLRVFNIGKPGIFMRAVMGEEVGTLVDGNAV